MATYRVVFEVSGITPFPTDMLRYDSCYPARGDDVASIERSLAKRERTDTVRLVHVGGSGKWRPEIGRWSSFGWSVEAVGPINAI